MSQTYSHRNGETEPPTQVGHYWFKGIVNGYSVAEKVTVMMWTGSGALRVIGIDEGSRLEHFHGQWWGPESEVPPWEVARAPAGESEVGES